MTSQLISNAEALRLFFTEEVYLVKNEGQISSTEHVNEAPQIVSSNRTTDVTAELSVTSHTAAVVQSIEPIVAPEKVVEFEYLGKNQKGILILVNDGTNKVSSAAGTALLRNLVKAIQLTNNDFALVNAANYQTATYEDFHGFFNCQLVLSFGVDAMQIGMSPQPPHQLVQVGTTRFVFTSNLDDLSTDTASKKMLWATLQQLKNG